MAVVTHTHVYAFAAIATVGAHVVGSAAIRSVFALFYALVPIVWWR